LFFVSKLDSGAIFCAGIAVPFYFLLAAFVFVTVFVAAVALGVRLLCC
jgi:hypothetical protein